jgi:hypothetical protein
MTQYEIGPPKNFLAYGEGSVAFTDSGVGFNDSSIGKDSIWSSEKTKAAIDEAINKAFGIPGKLLNNVSGVVGEGQVALQNSPCKSHGVSGCHCFRNYLHRLKNKLKNPFCNRSMVQSPGGKSLVPRPSYHRVRRYTMDLMHPIWLLERILGKDCVCKKCVNTMLYKIHKHKMRQMRPGHNKCTTCT